MATTRGRGKYRPTHEASVIPGLANGHTFRCGMCGRDLAVHAGRWRHRMLGMCCAECKKVDRWS